MQRLARRRGAESGHRPGGARQQEGGGHRRRRPGPHVRLRHGRDRGVHAAHHCARAQAQPPDRRSASLGRARLGPTGHQDPGDRRVHDPRRLVRAAARAHRGHLGAALAGRDAREDPPGPHGARGEAGGAHQVPRREHHLSLESERHVHHRRTAGRRRPYRTQDHRRYVWRLGRSRWRCLLGQGLHQSGPQRCVRRSLGGQVAGQGRPVQARARADLVRHRHRSSALHHHLLIRLVVEERGRASRDRQEQLRPQARQNRPVIILTHTHTHTFVYTIVERIVCTTLLHLFFACLQKGLGLEETDLQPDELLRPLRTRRVLLGAAEEFDFLSDESIQQQQQQKHSLCICFDRLFIFFLGLLLV